MRLLKGTRLPSMIESIRTEVTRFFIRDPHGNVAWREHSNGITSEAYYRTRIGATKGLIAAGRPGGFSVEKYTK